MTTDKHTPGYISPDWPAPANVRALVTLRSEGYSRGSYSSFNLAEHTGDDPRAVSRNRALLREYFRLPAEPVWLEQVHSRRVVLADTAACGTAADASWTGAAGSVCAVMTADCLPVLICDRAGSRVAAAHAGWRGLHAGVISNAVRCLACDPEELIVWLGPAIGPGAFEVGAEVVEAFIAKDGQNSLAFRQTDDRHWLCDLYRLARIELDTLGVHAVFGGNDCTFTDSTRFYSYRRDGETGRMASLIWLDE
ncbi:MAG: peptidoglycan editing factor PgeF [Oceanisphaera sp.]|nr:peptidoglycan editing factor PgeF [Oceanisphaera sp.]